jgi:hypothetical protein
MTLGLQFFEKEEFWLYYGEVTIFDKSTNGKDAEKKLSANALAYLRHKISIIGLRFLQTIY